MHSHQREHRAAVHRLPLDRGPGLLPGDALAAVQRHSRTTACCGFDEQSEAVSVFRQPADYTNGNTVDRQGRLVSCQHGPRRVVRTEHDGSITVLADRFEGKRFNSPNDVVVKSDDSIWFTDPSYGIDSNYEGFQAPSELGERRVYRIDPRTAAVTVVADGFAQPNGLAFSVDERRLYIVDSGKGRGIMRVFDVHGDKLSGGDVFIECADGVYDGLRIDVNDRIWTSAGEAVHCHEPRRHADSAASCCRSASPT